MKFLIQILELGIGVALISISNIFINFRRKVEKFSYFCINGFVIQWEVQIMLYIHIYALEPCTVYYFLPNLYPSHITT
jgi:hypothetical protein